MLFHLKDLLKEYKKNATKLIPELNNILYNERLVWLVWFYKISTIVGCLMPNPANIYKIYMICEQNSLLVTSFLNKPELMNLYTVKCFQVLCNTNLI